MVSTTCTFYELPIGAKFEFWNALGTKSTGIKADDSSYRVPGISTAWWIASDTIVFALVRFIVVPEVSTNEI